MWCQDDLYFSRERAIIDGEKAWAVDSSFRLYFYDGMLFWRETKHKTGYQPVPSWRTPMFGWMHAAECSRCALCAVEHESALEAA